MASASRKGSFSRSTRPRLIDPNGEYKAIRKVINTDCSTKQKCIISFDRSDLDDLENDYPVASITMKLINHSFDESFTPEDIQEVYPGTTEIALYVSEIPTRSVLLFKIENPSADDDSVEQRFFSAMLDLNHPVFKGFAFKNTFKLALKEFLFDTSEFSLDVYLRGSAVLVKHHVPSDIPAKKSKFIIDALEFVFQLNSNDRDNGPAPRRKRNEDIDWFYGQLKKYHDSEALPTASYPLQHPHIIPSLRKYQKQAVNWMLCREGVIPTYEEGAPALIETILDRMYIPIELKRSQQEAGVSAFFNPFVGYVCLKRPTLPSMPKGGILADEMGLGKTVEILSLIMLNPKPENDEEDSNVQPIRVKRGASPCEFKTKDSREESPESCLPQSSRKRQHTDKESDAEGCSMKVFKDSEVADGEEGAMEVGVVISENKDKMETTMEAKSQPKTRNRKKKRRQKPLTMKKRSSKSKSSKGKKRERKPDWKYMDSESDKAEDENETEEPVPDTRKLKTFDKVKPLYDAALGELNATKHAFVSHKFHGEFYSTNVGRKAFFECLCGEGLEVSDSEIVTCHVCSSSQHKQCVGVDNLPSSQLDGYLCPHCTSAAPLIPTKTTLIVTPNNIARQWINEIMRHVRKEKMKILFYKGVTKHGYVPPQLLGAYDLIITTYGVLSTELNYCDLPHNNSADGRRFRNPKRFLTIPSPLPSILWWRVCLDEAQMVEGISSRMSSMALKLQAEHYWCVTGTPINKGLEDLFGLFVFLGVVPLSDPFWWNSLVTNPFYQKDVSLLYQLFGTLIWSNRKRDVLDQLGIPPQTQIVHWLEFSPLESHFYKRLHNICRTKVVDKVQKICQNSQQGLTIRLSHLERRTLQEVLTPFLELRQACCHPQLVRGHTLTINKSFNETLTMEELLTQLIQKTKIQCGEDHRAVVASLNGAAGIHWILNEYVEASDKYREILQLASKHEHIFTTDTLQMLHALENLADLLDMNCPRVPYTLRDDSLRADATLLRVKYLENNENGVKSTHSSTKKATATIDQIRGEFLRKDESWWVTILNYAVRHDKGDDLLNRIKDDLAIYASKKRLSGSLANKFRGPASFQNAIIEKVTELDDLRLNVLQHLDELLSSDPSTFVESSVACHLRTYTGTGTHDFRCRLCLNFEKFSEYQHSLFSEDKGNVKDNVVRTGRNRQKLKIMGNLDLLSAEEQRLALLREEEELMETTGHVAFHRIIHDTKMLKDSDTERALRQLLSFGRINKLPEEALQDGSTHMKLYDSLKKEFKVLRLLWTRLFDQVSAFDELAQATTRISIRSNNDTTAPMAASSSNKPKVLNNWEQERAKKIQTVNLISHHELRPKLEELKIEYATALNDFNAHHGQLLYLHQLEKKEYKKQNEDECPICHQALGKAWCVLICGHSYCPECMKHVCPSSQSFLCPLCRKAMKPQDISFVDISLEERPSTSRSVSTSVPATLPDRGIIGSHSTKVKAVVEQLFQLQLTYPGEKVIVFSSWTVVLEIIGRALEQNGILFSGIMSGENKGNFQKTLKRFQENENVQVLLLPLSSGSKGLNLIEATHVFLVEPILNMASEQQGIGRVHRIGQTKPTFVHRFYVRDTIEEHLFEILKNHDVSSDDEGLLSLGDLKQLVSK